MFLSISQALQFMMSGLPMFGADTCGFSGNTDNDLCSRWMSLSAFFPFYRNHNVKATISQEAFRWSSVAEASRRAMSIRYSLLTYMYTLFYYAHTEGQMVMRALAWEFPNDASLAGTFSQFMLGPSLLITPVLIPNVDTVQGVFPGIGEGTNWYDWYTLQPVQANTQENVTLSAPIEHINVHVRGGSILPMQEPAYTTAETRANPYSLLVALDETSQATGSLYLDDGTSLVQNATKMVQVSRSHSPTYFSLLSRLLMTVRIVHLHQQLPLLKHQRHLPSHTTTRQRHHRGCGIFADEPVAHLRRSAFGDQWGWSRVWRWCALCERSRGLYAEWSVGGRDGDGVHLLRDDLRETTRRRAAIPGSRSTVRAYCMRGRPCKL